MKFSIQLGNFSLSLGRNAPARPPRKRSYPGAAINRLTNDWQGSNASADQEIWAARRMLIYRCRQLERSNDYVRRYFKLAENNVLGAYGIGLQMKIRESNRPGAAYDTLANDAIERAWHDWGRKQNASLNGRYSWCRIERLVLRSVLRDGGVLLRKHIVDPSQNPYGFTLQPLEIDHVDMDLNKVLTTGNEIRQGIEIDRIGRLIAFHILDRHPGDAYQANRRHLVIPADQIIYVAMPERIGQTACSPSLVSSMLRLQMLGGYEEAELVAAREGACKAGFITKTAPESYVGDAEDETGNQVIDMEPGTIRELEPGQGFVEHDPKHPNTAYPDFIKGVLRGLASGLGVSYNSLANDLEGVNYSSIRAGLLEEREEWKTLQEWLIEELHSQVFTEWLFHALMADAITLPGGSALPGAKYDKFNQLEWKPRRWAWVDPEKDIKSSIEAVRYGFSSQRRIVAEAGGDVEDVFQEIAEDQALAAKKGLEFPFIEEPKAAPGEPAKEPVNGDRLHLELG